MPRLINSATEDEGAIEYYAHGSCHVFAVAALQVFAAEARPCGFRVMLDPYECAWIDPRDPDNALNAVVHVYAVLEHEEREIAVDIFGIRELAAAEDDCRDIYAPGILAFEDCTELEDLMRFVSRGNDDPDDALKPLHEFDAKMVEEAARDVRMAFPDGLRPLARAPDCPALT